MLGINGASAVCITVVAWAATFTLPYLYDPVGGAGTSILFSSLILKGEFIGLERMLIGLKIGYIYGAGCLISALFIWLYIGETRGERLKVGFRIINNIG